MTEPSESITLELFADYFQFYLEDEKNGSSLEDSWTDEAVNRLLATAKCTIGVGTVRNMEVPVKINFYDSEPEVKIINLEKVNQINECDLEILSGMIVVAGCTDYFPEAKRIKVENGIYRVRIYYGNLEELSENGLEGEDFYELHLWQTNNFSPLKIIKQRVCY